MLRVALSAVLLFLFTSMNSTSVLASVSSTLYANREHDFHIYPPSGWEVDESAAANVPGGVVVFWGPHELETGVTVNIMISSKSVASTVSLEEYVSNEDSLTSIPEYRILSEDRREINGLPCIELVGTGVGTSCESLDSFTLKQKQVVFVQNGRVYWLSFVASTKYYDTYLPAFEESLRTFGLGQREKGSSEASSFSTLILTIVTITMVIALVGAYVVHHGRRTPILGRSIEGRERSGALGGGHWQKGR